MSTPPRAVVLLSGGLDSATCLAIARIHTRIVLTLRLLVLPRLSDVAGRPHGRRVAFELYRG